MANLICSYSERVRFLKDMALGRRRSTLRRILRINVLYVTGHAMLLRTLFVSTVFSTGVVERRPLPAALL